MMNRIFTSFLSKNQKFGQFLTFFCPDILLDDVRISSFCCCHFCSSDFNFTHILSKYQKFDQLMTFFARKFFLMM